MTTPLGPPTSSRPPAPASPPRPPQEPFQRAAQAFRLFFQELQEAFFERETLLTQIELALLCREHVLVTGPPGTAKSAVANSVLGRIVDAHSGLPSLFSKQLCETTVQADLIGPVNFKTLTETGRTEYLTEEGMLGAIHAFLDEVFDGRDMLLRSILNVLHERELKHGRKVTAGRLECAIMTSNRYLSEAVARSPELLLAFADRLSFICFVPKSFARPESRAAMLERATTGQRPELTAELTIQHLDALQAAVERVGVDGPALEGIELLADKLERALHQHVTKLPDYVPSKSFSQRSLVKALWALKAWVVREAIFHKPGRPLEATPQDLAGLRHFFLLGGPPQGEIESLLKGANDPRERAQLEILRLEHHAFDEALLATLQELPRSLDKESSELKVSVDRESAEEQGRNYNGEAAFTLGGQLLRKLSPGPRHKGSRAALLGAADALIDATVRRARRGISGQGEGRGGTQLLEAMRQVFELCRRVPELREGLPALVESTLAFARQGLEMTALSAESAAFDDALTLDGVVGLARRIQEELDGVRTFAAALASEAGEASDALEQSERHTRTRVAEALRRRIPGLFRDTGRREEQSLESLQADARRISALEELLVGISGSSHGLRQELITPLAIAHVQRLLTQLPFKRLEELASALQQTTQVLRREGVSVGTIASPCAPVLHERIAGWIAQQQQPAKVPALVAARAMTGEAYVDYRGAFTAEPVALELGAIATLAPFLGNDHKGKALAEQLRATVARAELERTGVRVRFLGQWLGTLLQQLGDPSALKGRADANQTFSALVRSRFPLLAVKEGELLRIATSLRALAHLPGDEGEKAKGIERQLDHLEGMFNTFSKTLLDVRARS